MTSNPLILVTNDDGVFSPGLSAAIIAAHGLGDLQVVAPREQQTGASRNFLRHPWTRYEETLTIDDIEIPMVAIDASPAQVTRAGIQLLAPRKPDLVISGINYGENLGYNVTISGTVGACIEAASFGIAALAIGLETDVDDHRTYSDVVDFTTASLVTRRIVQHVLANPLPDGVDILNVNVPKDATSDTPSRVTTVSRRLYYEAIIAHNPDRDWLEFTGYVRQADLENLERDSDIYTLVVDRVISISPLSIDLTAHRKCSELATWLEDFA